MDFMDRRHSTYSSRHPVVLLQKNTSDRYYIEDKELIFITHKTFFQVFYIRRTVHGHVVDLVQDLQIEGFLQIENPYGSFTKIMPKGSPLSMEGHLDDFYLQRIKRRMTYIQRILIMGLLSIKDQCGISIIQTTKRRTQTITSTRKPLSKLKRFQVSCFPH